MIPVVVMCHITYSINLRVITGVLMILVGNLGEVFWFGTCVDKTKWMTLRLNGLFFCLQYTFVKCVLHCVFYFGHTHDISLCPLKHTLTPLHTVKWTYKFQFLSYLSMCSLWIHTRRVTRAVMTVWPEKHMLTSLHRIISYHIFPCVPCLHYQSFVQ